MFTEMLLLKLIAEQVLMCRDIDDDVDRNVDFVLGMSDDWEVEL